MPYGWGKRSSVWDMNNEVYAACQRAGDIPARNYFTSTGWVNIGAILDGRGFSVAEIECIGCEEYERRRKKKHMKNNITNIKKEKNNLAVAVINYIERVHMFIDKRVPDDGPDWEYTKLANEEKNLLKTLKETYGKK